MCQVVREFASNPAGRLYWEPQIDSSVLRKYYQHHCRLSGQRKDRNVLANSICLRTPSVVLRAPWKRMFNSNLLFASLVWGSVGLGYFIYGKKQASGAPLIGGILMMAVSYFIGSALMMSLICSALMGAIYLIRKKFD